MVSGPTTQDRHRSPRIQRPHRVEQEPEEEMTENHGALSVVKKATLPENVRKAMFQENKGYASTAEKLDIFGVNAPRPKKKGR